MKDFISDEDMEKLAPKNGFISDADMDKLTSKPTSKTTGAESFARGAAQGALLGFPDELTGGFEALKDVATDDKVGLKDLLERYGKRRDESRKNYDEAAEANPWASGAGNLTGGLATLAVPGLNLAKGASLAKAAVAGARVGAIGGLGSSDAKDVAGMIEDTGKGAAFGGAGGVALPLIGKGVKAAIPALKSARAAIPDVKGLAGVARAGFKEGSDEASSLVLPLVGDLPKMAGGVKGAVQSIRGARELGAQVRALGSGKDLNGFADDLGDVGIDMLEAGPSRAKEFAAARAGSSGSQTDADQYRGVLEFGVDRRIAARDFNAKDAALELAPLVDELGREFKAARGAGYSALQKKAAMAFDKSMTKGVMPKLRELSEKATLANSIQPRTRAALQDVRNILVKGQSPIAELAEGRWPTMAPSDKFARLQAAREAIDAEITWNTDNKIPAGEKLLRKMRDEIDASLKKAPGKAEGDAFYSRGLDVEAGLFDATKFRRNGKNKVDEFRIAKLYGNNDASGRFGNAIKQMKEYVQDPTFDEGARVKIQGLLDRLEANRLTAQDQRTLFNVRMKNGPSSPAIEAQGYALNKANLPTESIGSPGNYLNSVDQFIKEYGVKGYGKSFADMSKAEKVGLTKLYTWQKANPKATQAQMQTAANRFLAPKNTP